MKKLLLTSILASSLLYSEVGDVNDTVSDNLKSGVELMLTEYNFENFWETFSISGSEWVVCKTTDLNKGMFGMAARMSQPIYIGDVSNVNNKVASLGIEIGKERLDKTGELTEGGAYANIFKMPLMGILLKKTTKGLFAFDSSVPKIVYLGITDVKKWNDPLALSMAPERSMFLNVRGAIAGAFSCASSELYGALSESYRRESSAGKRLGSVIDANYYTMGCLGSIPVGTISKHPAPIAAGKLIMASILSDLHSKKGMAVSFGVKHRTRNALNGYSEDILCKGDETNPILPLTQYTSQLIYPTTGEVLEMGVSPLEYAFKGKGEADKTMIFIINERRDYAAFAYQD